MPIPYQDQQHLAIVARQQDDKKRDHNNHEFIRSYSHPVFNILASTVTRTQDLLSKVQAFATLFDRPVRTVKVSLQLSPQHPEFLIEHFRTHDDYLIVYTLHTDYTLSARPPYKPTRVKSPAYPEIYVPSEINAVYEYRLAEYRFWFHVPPVG